MNKKIATCHYPHGWMDYKPNYSGIAPTIDTGIAYWYTLVVEIYEHKDNREWDMDKSSN